MSITFKRTNQIFNFFFNASLATLALCCLMEILPKSVGSKAESCTFSADFCYFIVRNMKMPFSSDKNVAIPAWACYPSEFATRSSFLVFLHNFSIQLAAVASPFRHNTASLMPTASLSIKEADYIHCGQLKDQLKTLSVVSNTEKRDFRDEI